MLYVHSTIEKLTNILLIYSGVKSLSAAAACEKTTKACLRPVQHQIMKIQRTPIIRRVCRFPAHALSCIYPNGLDMPRNA